MATHSYDQFIAACAGYPKPNPFASDWCITDVGEEHEYRLPPSINRAKSLADADEWAMAIKCSVTAEVSVLVYAKSEKAAREHRSEEHTSELQSLMRISYAVFCLKKTKRDYSRRHEKKK